MQINLRIWRFQLLRAFFCPPVDLFQSFLCRNVAVLPWKYTAASPNPNMSQFHYNAPNVPLTAQETASSQLLFLLPKVFSCSLLFLLCKVKRCINNLLTASSWFQLQQTANELRATPHRRAFSCKTPALHLGKGFQCCSRQTWMCFIWISCESLRKMNTSLRKMTCSKT